MEKQGRGVVRFAYLLLFFIFYKIPGLAMDEGLEGGSPEAGREEMLREDGGGLGWSDGQSRTCLHRWFLHLAS